MLRNFCKNDTGSVSRVTNTSPEIFKSKNLSDILKKDLSTDQLEDVVHEINPVYKELYKKLKHRESDGDLLKYENGVLSIDFKNMHEISDKILIYIKENQLALATGAGEAALASLSAGLIYRGITKSYAHSLTELAGDVEKLPANEKLVFMQSQASNIRVFNKSGAVMLTMIFYIMIQTFKQNIALKFPDVKIGIEGSTGRESIIPFVPFIKNSRSK